MGLAAIAFTAAALASASAWHGALASCGVRTGRAAVAARYAVGSLVSAVTPAPTGAALRIGLVSRLLPPGRGPLTVVGAVGIVALVRGVLNAGLFLAATASASPVLALPGLVLLLGAAACALLVVRRSAGGRLAELADAAAGLARSPQDTSIVAGWVALALGARVVAVALVAAALGVGSPLTAAMFVVPALALAAQVPLLPGNIGISSAAVTLVLRGRHVALAPALSAGIAVHAVETLASLAFGAAGLLALARPQLRRRVAFAAAVPAALVLAAFLGFWAGDLG